jgi:nicotinamidase-related amidase
MSDVVPAKSALLLMDFQNGIVGMVGDAAPALLGRAKQARETARKAGMAVMYVRVALTDADVKTVPAHNQTFSSAVASGWLADGSKSTEIHAELAPAEGEEVFRKCRFGAFSTTNLTERLKARGIDTLFLTGISTSGVVLSTLRYAADRDYRLFVVSDVCADPDPEVHRVLMGKVFPHQATVIDLAAFKTLAGA